MSASLPDAKPTGGLVRRLFLSLLLTLTLPAAWLAAPAAAEAAPVPAVGNDASKSASLNLAPDLSKLKAEGIVLRLAPKASQSTTGSGLKQLIGRGVTSVKAVGFGVIAARFGRVFTGDEAQELAAQLQALPEVALAEPNWVMHVNDQKVGPQVLQSGATWGLDRIDQRALPLDGNYDYPQSGSGVTAYIIDSGLNATHTEFSGRVVAGTSFVSDGLGTGDCNGHGTHVAGTIGGTTYGVAKAVKLRPVRVGDCNGASSVDTMIQALNWIRTNHSSGRAVVNISMGGGFNQQLNDAVAAVVNANIPVVVASGNEGANACYTSPASAPSAITVNASTATDYDASFSNYGSCTDIYAPGENITSAWIGTNSATRTISGTSMASPHVAGVVAQLLQASASATAATIWQTLQAKATRANFLPSVPTDAKYLLYTGSAPVNENPVEPDDEVDLNIYGATVAWDDAQLIEPSSCTYYTFRYSNGTGVRLLSFDLEITSRYQDSLDWDGEVGVNDGVSGNWSVFLCPSDLVNGLGPYFVTVLITDYTNAVYTAQKEIVFLPRAGSTNQLQPLQPREADYYYMDIYGAYLIWDMGSLYLPLPNSCSRYFFTYANYTGVRLLSMEMEFLDSYNSSMAWESLVGINDGVSGVWALQICSSRFTNGVGPYSLRFTIDDYYTEYQSQGALSFTERPKPFTTASTPTISGEARYNSTLTANTGAWDSGTSFSYQWLRAGSEIAGATSAQYTPNESDIGTTLSVRVTGSKSGYETTQRVSAATAAVAEGRLQSTPTPAIYGTVAVGQSVGVTAGNWDSGVSLTYQWWANGSVISGANSETYLIGQTDAGKSLTVTVTGSKALYSSVTMTSAARAVPLLKLLKTPVPVIKGTVQTGKKVTASPGAWDSGVKLSYQWLKNGKAIAGARSAAYVIKQTDKGAKLTVKVTGAKAGYQSVSKVSVAVVPKK